MGSGLIISTQILS